MAKKKVHTYGYPESRSLTPQQTYNTRLLEYEPLRKQLVAEYYEPSQEKIKTGERKGSTDYSGSERFKILMNEVGHIHHEYQLGNLTKNERDKQISEAKHKYINSTKQESIEGD